MSGVHKSERKEHKFEVKDNAVILKRMIRELSLIRNFGYRIREAKLPGNWDEWSRDSQARWMQEEAARIQRLRELDATFLARKRNTVERDLEEMMHGIAKANSIKRPRTIRECDMRLEYQRKAIAALEALEIDLTDIMDTVPINKNWMTQVEPAIEKELQLIHGWIRGDAPARAAVEAAEKKRRGEIIQGAVSAIKDEILGAVMAALGYYDEG